MASLSSLPSLYLSPNPLRPSSKASPCFGLNPNSVRFPSKANEFRRVPVPLCRASSKKIVPNLQADDFRHPLDLEITRRFRARPDQSSEATLTAFFAADELIEIDDTTILAGPNQHSDTYKLLAETAEALNISTPLLYIRRNAVPVARAVGLETPYIVVHSRILEILTPQELRAVLARELAHLKCDHYLELKVMDVLVHNIKFFPDWLISQSQLEELLRWGQAAVLSCDRASLLVAQDPKVVISAIMKLDAGCPSLIEEVDVDAYLARARAYVGSFSYRDDRATRLAHPVPEVRAYEIDEWSRSEEYAMLLTSTTAPGEALIRKKIGDSF